MTDVQTGAVAAVIPARPDEPFLCEALDSALRQPEVEDIIVATNISDSPTARLASTHRDPRIRLVMSDGPSAGENLNAAITAAESPWLAFLDADDCWPGGRIAAGLRAANSIPGIQLVLGQQRIINADGVLMTDIRPPLLGAALITREAANRIGPFDASVISQMRWVLRARDLGVPTLESAEVFLYRREHSANLSRLRRSELHQAYLSLARERAARHRKARGHA